MLSTYKDNKRREQKQVKTKFSDLNMRIVFCLIPNILKGEPDAKGFQRREK